MAINVRTDDELDHALNALSEGLGVSKQKVIRDAVLEKYREAADHRLFTALGDVVVEEFKDALDRLAQ